MLSRSSQHSSQPRRPLLCGSWYLVHSVHTVSEARRTNACRRQSSSVPTMPASQAMCSTSRLSSTRRTCRRSSSTLSPVRKTRALSSSLRHQLTNTSSRTLIYPKVSCTPAGRPAEPSCTPRRRATWPPRSRCQQSIFGLRL